MSDTNECCVCYEPTEHLTLCSHLVCESCYSQVPTCPMCRAPFDNGISSLEVTYDDDDDDDDDDKSEDSDSEDNYKNIPVTLINAAYLSSEETAQLVLD